MTFFSCTPPTKTKKKKKEKGKKKKEKGKKEMWDPAWWCCARKTESHDLTDRMDRARGDNQGYMYVTDLLNDVYSADRKGLSGRTVL